MRTIKPKREHVSLEHLGEFFEINCENMITGTLQFGCGMVGNLLFDANSFFTQPEKPSLVLVGTLGVMYMADPNQFGGEVKVVLKGNNEPFVIQQSYAYNSECRGHGVAEMAWSLRRNRKNCANKEMAYHALEVLHGMVRSSETKSNQMMKSTFEKTPPILRGYCGQTFFEFIEEMSIG